MAANLLHHEVNLRVSVISPMVEVWYVISIGRFKWRSECIISDIMKIMFVKNCRILSASASSFGCYAFKKLAHPSWHSGGLITTIRKCNYFFRKFALSIVNPNSLQVGSVVARVKVTDHDSDQITYQIESSSSFVPVSLIFYHLLKLHVMNHDMYMTK